ncbi:dihydrofolate reductase family protein [Glutamicibacter endophyticus]|uniref:dihydrofolate reductase family protein n=1 Tax=Glutamicibacter endophyticus TaxID=1522174 RepID=UPI003AEF3718
MRQLLPTPIDDPTDDQLLQAYAAAARPFVRFNFVSSLDGSAQLEGRSAALGSAADRRAFALQRRLADVILVGAGTVHAEGYSGPLVSEEDQQWRRDHGRSAHPVLAIVSRSLSIEPDAEVLRESPAEVLLFTTAAPDAAQRAAYPEHVQICRVPESGGGCDPEAIVQQLADRGLGFIHAEGGPRIFGQFSAANQVDSLCLSFSPRMVAGDGARIANDPREAVHEMQLNALFEEDSMLLADYRRAEVR